METKYKISPERNHARSIMAAMEGLKTSLEKAKRDPMTEIADFLDSMNASLAKLAEISDREIKDGEPGVSVVKAEIVDKELVLTLSNKETFNAGKVVGDDGLDGEDVDEDKLVQKLLSRIPKPPKEINEDEMIKKFLSKIPKVERLTAQEIIKVIKDKKALSYNDLKDLPDIVKLIKKYTAHFEERLSTRIVPGANALRALQDIKWDTATSNTKYLRPVFLNGKLESL